jgi:hypothetical protein
MQPKKLGKKLYFRDSQFLAQQNGIKKLGIFLYKLSTGL